MKNYTYNFHDYEEIAPVSVNEPHMPILILADISGSMRGMPIRNLNQSINRFVSDVCRDPKAAKCVDVAVVGFNDGTSVEQNWRPVTDLQPVDFEAGGGTDLAGALEEGIRMLRERSRLYEDNGIAVRMPYMILITDGYGGDVSEISKVIHKRTEEHKMKLWVLGVNDYDRETVAVLTRGKRAFDLIDGAEFDYNSFFNFLAVSVKAVSTSSPDRQAIPITKDIAEASENLHRADLSSYIDDCIND